MAKKEEKQTGREAAGELLDAFAVLAGSFKKVLLSKEVDELIVGFKATGEKIDKYNKVIKSDG